MSGFKLLAIRPLVGCSTKILKGLKEGMIYQFHRDEFSLDFINSKNTNSDVKVIRIVKKKEVRLYDLDNLKINISAIVGKNGSGKSSLIDLFYSFCYSISVIDKKIEEINQLTNKELIDNNQGNLQVLYDVNLYKEINCEIYYQFNNDIFRIKLSKGNYIHEANLKGEWAKIDFYYADFFYTLAINYSLYGLNSRDNPWCYFLFHKNDGYQIPIVINPYRVNGNIDVNSELHLAQTRTLLNLSSVKTKNPLVVNGKRISGVEFILDLIENDSIKINDIVAIGCKKVFNHHYNVHNESIFELFNRVSRSLAGFTLKESDIVDLKKSYSEEIDKEASKKYLNETSILPILEPTVQRIHYQFIKYVINKLFKICINYPNDYDFLQQKTTEFGTKILELKDLDRFIYKLTEDKSHITIKLRQALYSIKEGYFNIENRWKRIDYEKDRNHYSYSIYLEWFEVQKMIIDSEKKNRKILEERMEIIPGSFVKPKLHIKEKKFKNSSHLFSTLSSGEQQLSNTLQTITYHLYNLNSVHGSSFNKIKYKNINLIFDEIELYFHPEFQRRFISNLIESIEQLKINNIESINMLFSTHSPFILSDIPESHILRLENGLPKKVRSSQQTFGANINDLLADGFYLNTVMGDFANNKIMKVIEHINQNKFDNKDKEIIQLIGDSFLKSSIQFYKDSKND